MADLILPLGSAVKRKDIDAAEELLADGEMALRKRKKSLRTNPLSPLGERIMAAMHYAGYRSQNELEHAMFGEKSRGKISRYMSGKRGQSYIDADIFLRMANLMGVDFTWLTTGSGEMTPPLQPPPASQRVPK